jgi:hypothetical protein
MVVWHPIKSVADLPHRPHDCWLTLSFPSGRCIGEGWYSVAGGWWIDGRYQKWDADHPLVIAWADYTPPKPYEGEA